MVWMQPIWPSILIKCSDRQSSCCLVVFRDLWDCTCTLSKGSISHVDGGPRIHKTNLTCLFFPKNRGCFCVGDPETPTIYSPFLSLLYLLSEYPFEQSVPSRQLARTLLVKSAILHSSTLLKTLQLLLFISFWCTGIIDWSLTEMIHYICASSRNKIYNELLSLNLNDPTAFNLRGLIVKNTYICYSRVTLERSNLGPIPTAHRSPLNHKRSPRKLELA